MSEIENKIEIIDAISTRHPSIGVEKGWSYYVGGMKDSGDWYFRKMLNVSIEELKSFLDKLVENENKPKVEKQYTEEEKKDMNIIHQDGNIFYTEYDRKQMVKLYQEVESKLFFGK